MVTGVQVGAPASQQEQVSKIVKRRRNNSFSPADGRRRPRLAHYPAYKTRQVGTYLPRYRIGTEPNQSNLENSKRTIILSETSRHSPAAAAAAATRQKQAGAAQKAGRIRIWSMDVRK